MSRRQTKGGPQIAVKCAGEDANGENKTDAKLYRKALDVAAEIEQITAKKVENIKIYLNRETA